MKSDKHNELLPRDAALARLLEEALESKAAGDAHSSACPDAEILAAYAERGLSEREVSLWGGHIADCGRCQKIIAGVVAGGENLEEAGEQGSLAPAIVIRKPGRGARESSRWPGFWRWWVPGLGLATAAVLWFALRPALLRQASPQRAAATAGTSQGSAQGNPAESSTKPEETQMAQAQAPAPPPATISGAAGASGGAIRDSEERRANSSAEASKKALKQESLQSKAQSGTQSEAQAPSVSSAVSAAPPVPEAKEKDSGALSAQTTDTKTQATDELAETPAALAAPSAGAAVTRPAAPAAAAARAPEPAPEASQTQSLARQLDRSAGNAGFSSSNQVRALAKIANSPIVFGSPDRSALWRVGPGGLIEASSDRGQTWHPQASRVTADLLAGAAPSAKIAWAVGRGGIIVRTEDGERWQRVTPPSFANAAGAQNAAPPDWISVEARDELHATIVSRDLRRYATADGGRTWVQQQ